MVRRGRREHVFATTPFICSNPQEVQTAELGCHAVGQVTEFPNLSLSVVRLEPGLSESASRRVQPVGRPGWTTYQISQGCVFSV